MKGSDSHQTGTFSLIGFVQVMKRLHHQRGGINAVDSLGCLAPVAGLSVNPDFHAVDHG